MGALKLQKRLAASVLKYGKGMVCLDPNETNEISLANSPENQQLEKSFGIWELASLGGSDSVLDSWVQLLMVGHFDLNLRWVGWCLLIWGDGLRLYWLLWLNLKTRHVGNGLSG